MKCSHCGSRKKHSEVVSGPGIKLLICKRCGKYFVWERRKKKRPSD